jgi:hypothetical protein
MVEGWATIKQNNPTALDVSAYAGIDLIVSCIKDLAALRDDVVDTQDLANPEDGVVYPQEQLPAEQLPPIENESPNTAVVGGVANAAVGDQGAPVRVDTEAIFRDTYGNVWKV